MTKTDLLNEIQQALNKFGTITLTLKLEGPSHRDPGGKYGEVITKGKYDEKRSYVNVTFDENLKVKNRKSVKLESYQIKGWE